MREKHLLGHTCHRLDDTRAMDSIIKSGQKDTEASILSFVLYYMYVNKDQMRNIAHHATRRANTVVYFCFHIVTLPF